MINWENVFKNSDIFKNNKPFQYGFVENFLHENFYNELYNTYPKIDENWYKKKITAKFICALTIYWPNNFSVRVVGKVKGTISKTKKGNNGFGYDPIFIPLNSRLTFGEISPTKKYKIDHRMKAFKKIKKFF